MEIRKLVENASEKIEDPDVIIDPLNFTFHWVSKRHAKLLGYSVEELEGKEVFPFTNLPTTDEEKGQLMVTMGMPEGKTMIPLKTKDGRVIVVEFRHIRFEVEGKPFMVAKLVQ